jgi:hypothetical protein
MSARVEQYVRHARKFGDPRSVFETAYEDSLSAVELGSLASRLRRLEIYPENAFRWSSDGPKRRKIYWPKFRLTGDEKRKLARDLLAAGVPELRVRAYLATTSSWLADFASPSGADDATPGHRSSSANFGRDRLSTSGDADDFPAGQTLPPSIIVPGMRFGRLTVLEAGRDKTNRKIIVCACDCGAETTAKLSHLLRGEKRACGCLRRERMAAMRRRTKAAG